MAVLKRLALLFAPQPADVPRPPLRLAPGELTAFRHGRWSLPAAAPQASAPQLIMLIPGFLASPGSMGVLRLMLERAGHNVVDWPYRFNTIIAVERLEALRAQLAALHQQSGRQISIIGWSLGGFYAREASRLCPQAVRRVITLGTPFSGDLRANRAWRAIQFVGGRSVMEPVLPGDLAEKPPVETIAIWSPSDGVISPHSARGNPGERDRAIEVDCSHMGMVRHPGALAAIAATLT